MGSANPMWTPAIHCTYPLSPFFGGRSAFPTSLEHKPTRPALAQPKISYVFDRKIRAEDEWRRVEFHMDTRSVPRSLHLKQSQRYRKLQHQFRREIKLSIGTDIVLLWWERKVGLCTYHSHVKCEWFSTPFFLLPPRRNSYLVFCLSLN